MGPALAHLTRLPETRHIAQPPVVAPPSAPAPLRGFRGSAAQQAAAKQHTQDAQDQAGAPAQEVLKELAEEDLRKMLCLGGGGVFDPETYHKSAPVNSDAIAPEGDGGMRAAASGAGAAASGAAA